MRNLKDELQHIIFGDGPVHETDQLKKVQIFPGGNAEAGLRAQKRQRLKSEEAAELLNFATQQKIFYETKISEADFSYRDLPCWEHEGLFNQLIIYRGVHQRLKRFGGIGNVRSPHLLVSQHDHIFLRINPVRS